MPTFAYVAVDAAGKKREGVLDAQDKKSAIARITAEGRFITSIKESDGRSESYGKQEEKKGGRPSRNDLALFTRRLADLASSGLPLDRVLQVLSEQTENARLSEAVADTLNDVRGGLPISASLAKHPKIFPDVYTMTIRAGEASGQLPLACERLADLLENEVGRRSLIVSSLVYPAILSVVALGVVTFLLTFVVPKLSVVFEDNKNLPLPTTILLGITHFLTNQWYVVAGGLALVVFGGRAFLATEGGQVARDRFLLNAPIISNV
ncbi:MAG: type II secretion system F family protein, partial [Armatimonadota bacterium]